MNRKTVGGEWKTLGRIDGNAVAIPAAVTDNAAVGDNANARHTHCRRRLKNLWTGFHSARTLLCKMLGRLIAFALQGRREELLARPCAPVADAAATAPNPASFMPYTYREYTCNRGWILKAALCTAAGYRQRKDKAFHITLLFLLRCSTKGLYRALASKQI